MMINWIIITTSMWLVLEDAMHLITHDIDTEYSKRQNTIHISDQ